MALTATGRGQQVATATVLKTHVCPTCSVLFAIPEDLDDRLRNNPGPRGRQAYCPNGHGWHIRAGDTDADRQRARAEEAERELAYTRRQRDAQTVEAEAQKLGRQRAERSARAIRAHRDRVLRLIAAGTCPVGKCGRNLGDHVRAHVEAEHPPFYAHYLAPEA